MTSTQYVDSDLFPTSHELTIVPPEILPRYPLSSLFGLPSGFADFTITSG